VPVNRASSVLAGIVASYAMALIFGGSGIPASELVGAALIIGAITALSIGPALEASRASSRAVETR
jgi:hypothetical protein